MTLQYQVTVMIGHITKIMIFSNWKILNCRNEKVLNSNRYNCNLQMHGFLVSIEKISAWHRKIFLLAICLF